MPIYDAKTIPPTVSSTTKDAEIAEWLKTGPVLGAHKPIHVQRREHDAFIDKKPTSSWADRVPWPRRSTWNSSGSRLSSFEACRLTLRSFDLPTRRRVHCRLIGPVRYGHAEILRRKRRPGVCGVITSLPRSTSGLYRSKKVSS